MRFFAIILIGFAVHWAVMPSQAVAGSEEGVWGVVKSDGANPKCSGTAVIVLKNGRYWRVLPNLGATTGAQDYVMSRSAYRVEAGRVVVAPAFSLTNPEPAQRFLIDPIGPKLVREKSRTVWSRCPEGALKYFDER